MTRLRHLGFIAALAENLTTPGHPNRFGLSLVEQFSSDRSAATELKNQTGTSAPGAPWTYFAVPGIPRAVGFAGGSSGSGGRNVAVAVGPYYYVVGAGWNGGTSNAVTRSRLIAAAFLLYHRMKRQVGGPSPAPRGGRPAPLVPVDAS